MQLLVTNVDCRCLIRYVRGHLSLSNIERPMTVERMKTYELSICSYRILRKSQLFVHLINEKTPEAEINPLRGFFTSPKFAGGYFTRSTARISRW